MLTSKVQETINFFSTLTSIHNSLSNIHFNSATFTHKITSKSQRTHNALR